MTKSDVAMACLILMLAAGCGGGIRPVEIFPEDTCDVCRMAVSDQRFASEIIEDDGTVHKFDDLGCLQKFRAKGGGMKIAALYVKDYDTGAWIAYEKSTIVETGIATPMASGRVAFAAADRARAFARAHPLEHAAAAGCCSGAEE